MELSQFHLGIIYLIQGSTDDPGMIMAKKKISYYGLFWFKLTLNV